MKSTSEQQKEKNCVAYNITNFELRFYTLVGFSIIYT
jgi:hypothetical protein